MADNKSREVLFDFDDIKEVAKALEVSKRGSDEEYSETVLKEIGVNTAETSSIAGSALTVKVDVDVSEALTGLKALQREAREAVKALRELEEAQKKAGKIPIYPFVGHPNTPEGLVTDADYAQFRPYKGGEDE